MKGILGVKKEMTQIFDKDGNATACTIVDVSEAVIVGKRTEEKDGYNALVLGYGKKKNPSDIEKKNFKDLKFVPMYIKEVRMDELEDCKVGDEVKLDDFKVGDKVNVSAKTKGKGFQGVMKRWGFKGGPRTHGQSDRERAPGSIGGGTDPGRVYKGKKMPGRMGGKKKTIMNLEIVRKDEKDKLICIKGGIPGARGTFVTILKKE